MQLVLVMFRAGGERRSFSVTRNVTVIGRREDCDLRIPVAEVSRKHCRLLRDGDVMRLEDLGSSNGTFHNGQRVQHTELNAGDSLQVGPVVFVAQIDGVPADDELQPFTMAKAKSLSDSVATSGDSEGSLAPISVEVEEGQPSDMTVDMDRSEGNPGVEAAADDASFAIQNEEAETQETDDVNLELGGDESA